MKVNQRHSGIATGVTIARYFVGLLFIISGLVKANDPLGLSYKMQEFFEVWNTGLGNSSFFLKNIFINLFEALHNHSLQLSIVMIFLEIMAGIALIVGWQKKIILNGLLLLILFFTFLTGYAYFSGKFKNCGCFGDCLPISPLTSLLKDVVLLLLIIFLVANQKYIQPLKNTLLKNGLLFLFLLVSIGFQWYALTYLPIADCLPFKKGNNITQQMQMPPGSRPDSFAIRFIYSKEGKQYEFSPSTFPADLENYTYVDRVDKLIQKGNAEPPIKGFSLISNNTTDSTQPILAMEKAIILFHLKETRSASWKEPFSKIYAWANSNNIPVYISTSTKENAEKLIAGTAFKNTSIFTTDVTAIRTAARTPLTLYYLKKGTIINKWSNASFDKAYNYLASTQIK